MMKRRMQIVATSAVESDLYLQIAGWVGANVCVRKYPALPDGSFPTEEWARTISNAESNPRISSPGGGL